MDTDMHASDSLAAVSTSAHHTPPGFLADLAARADIRFNGNRPWDIQVHDPAVYSRILRHGSLGFGESYMDGLWDSQALDVTFDRLLRARIDEALGWRVKLRGMAAYLRDRMMNRQSTARAFQVGEQHYDAGNDIFQAMLDPTMSYSCGYWQDTDYLAQAQWNKLDLICRKLDLQPGEKLLDIGCGWGGLAIHAAREYGVSVVGITVSREQQALARERCQGLPIEIRLTDYRSLEEPFDKAVSVGMFEHVGSSNYATYFDTVARLLPEDGLFLLHTIGSDRSAHNSDAWLDKYIFPNGQLPSAAQLSDQLEQRFLIEDWHNFGPDYDRTLLAWWDRFNAAWPELQARYSKRFYRMWHYYLMCCAGYFRARQGQLWQLVLSKPGRNTVYRSVR